MKKLRLPDYTLKRSKRAKRVSIAIRSERVVVTAPNRLNEDTIHSFVADHIDWIERTLADLREQRAEWIFPDGVTQDHIDAVGARAKKFILERLRMYAPIYKVTYNRVYVKDMKSRWGSCSKEGNMSFHYRLFFLPLELADYIIVHELCHLIHLNHSRAFWKLVSATIPDYQKKRREIARYDI